MTEPVKQVMKESVNMAKKMECECEGFQTIDLGESQELIGTTSEINRR